MVLFSISRHYVGLVAIFDDLFCSFCDIVCCCDLCIFVCTCVYFVVISCILLWPCLCCRVPLFVGTIWHYMSAFGSCAIWFCVLLCWYCVLFWMLIFSYEATVFVANVMCLLRLLYCVRPLLFRVDFVYLLVADVSIFFYRNRCVFTWYYAFYNTVIVYEDPLFCIVLLWTALT